MLTLIKNGNVYSPKAEGKLDLLLGGGQILARGEEIDIRGAGLDVHVIDARGMFIVPGFIDSHVHIIGGGGEGGYRTRTPELMLTDATMAGVTTVVGVIGTDGTSRTMEDLIAKAHALEEEGITCYVHTGSYQLPVKTLTGSIQSDFLLIDKIIGVGEIAISDHRSSQPTMEEVTRVAAEARVGGMLSGKAGVVNIHVGDRPTRLEMLQQIGKETDLPLTQFLPTHINRNRELFNAGIQYAKEGGIVDFTTSSIDSPVTTNEVSCSQGLRIMLEEGVPLDQITFTSDAQGSLPSFNEKGELIGLQIGRMSSLFNEVRKAVLDENLPLESALHVITKTPAKRLALRSKGALQIGYDADLVLLEEETLKIDSVFAKGKQMVKSGQPIVKGTFE